MALKVNGAALATAKTGLDLVGPVGPSPVVAPWGSGEQHLDAAVRVDPEHGEVGVERAPEGHPNPVIGLEHTLLVHPDFDGRRKIPLPGHRRGNAGIA
jgi:hypothetical protein